MLWSIQVFSFLMTQTEVKVRSKSPPQKTLPGAVLGKDEKTTWALVLPPEKGYTHCLMSGPMSLPETLEMDLRKAWVDRSIWLHIWLWYFWDEAVLARLRSLLKTYRTQKKKKKTQTDIWLNWFQLWSTPTNLDHSGGERLEIKKSWLTCSMNSMLIRFSISLITRWALHWNIL